MCGPVSCRASFVLAASKTSLKGASRSGSKGGEGSKKTRSVLDAVHERETGKLRVRVNDGREVAATRGAAVEIALTNIGVVLFNPKIMVSVFGLHQ